MPRAKRRIMFAKDGNMAGMLKGASEDAPWFVMLLLCMVKEGCNVRMS